MTAKDHAPVEEQVAVALGPPPRAQEKSGNWSWILFWITSALVGLVAFLLVWQPMQRQNKLWGVLNVHPIESVGDDLCRRVSAPSFCSDVVIDNDSGLAFLACDPFKPAFYPPYDLYNASRVYGGGGIWLYDINDPKTPPMKLPFQEEATLPHPFHPVSLTISPVAKLVSPGEEAAGHVLRLLVVSYPDNIDEGVVEVIDYHLPPASFLTSLFGIKHTERGGDLSYVATIKNPYFTAPAGIVAVKDQPSLLSEGESHAIPSFYITNTYHSSGLMRNIVEKGLKIARADLVFYNAKAEGAMRVGFGIDRPGPVTTDDSESGQRVYVSTQDGVVHLFEQYIDMTGKQTSTVPIEDQHENLQHPSRDEEIQVFHPTFIQSSHFATNFPIVGLAALPPAPNALGGDIFAIGSPKHHLFRKALADDMEETVPVSILRMRPFYYIFNRTIKGTEKIYCKDDPRLKSGTREDPHGEPERKRWWEATTVWTGVDFGAGPGSVAVKDAGDKVIVLGVGGGKKGGLVICSVNSERVDVTSASAIVR